jgi:4-aminobutyrate aminotransferase
MSTEIGPELIIEEGESNLSWRRKRWAASFESATSKSLLERDAEHFLHQSVSSPCLSAISKAEGAWIEDTEGRCFMDFHGNSVHHIGYSHPRLMTAIKNSSMSSRLRRAALPANQQWNWLRN